MLGDDRVRFCLGCEKNVFNLSALPREEAEALLQARMGGEMCVRFYERSDGTILTQDCPVGAKKKQRKKLALAVAGAGVLAAAAATTFLRSAPRRSTTQGMVAQPAPDEPSVPPLPVEPAPREVKGERVPVMMGLVAPVPQPRPQPKGRTPLTR